MQEIIGEVNQIQEAIGEMEKQDENRKKEKNKIIKNIEKKKEPQHTDNVKMGDLDNIINEFLSEDVVKNNNESRKEESKSLKIKIIR